MSAILSRPQCVKYVFFLVSQGINISVSILLIKWCYTKWLTISLSISKKRPLSNCFITIDYDSVLGMVTENTTNFVGKALCLLGNLNLAISWKYRPQGITSNAVSWSQYPQDNSPVWSHEGKHAEIGDQLQTKGIFGPFLNPNMTEYIIFFKIMFMKVPCSRQHDTSKCLIHI